MSGQNRRLPYCFRYLVFIGGIMVLYTSCHQKVKPLFTLMNAQDTGLTFSNELPYTEEFNTYTYRNFYNGGGVALGDINNDGWTDVFFTGNIVGNKLYLNKGNWTFDDITDEAGVACKGVWSTGATFADINGDGWLDLYVCKAGKPGGENRHNSLFINNGNLTFTDKAKEAGLDVMGLSIHSAFFDYDRDGDLDCYILNNSLRSVGGYDLKEGQRNEPDPDGNKFFRNDNGVFTNITTEAGIYSSRIGYGLGITLSDFNLDGWTDIFISNDFFERDYLYINQQDGTFREEGESAFSSLSMGSMGADACDIDNDLLPDLFVTEMLPQTLERKKTKTQYETWDKYAASVASGYHHQFSRNVLQRNMGNGQFFEIGRQAGVSATEWSWASLVQDFDNDGLKDLFVSNGLFKDLLDKDYLNFSANANMIRSRINDGKNVLTMLVDSMPSRPVKNCMFQNKGQFSFSLVSEEWGLGQESFSNGSAYGDLDNDGDLDLLVNNANMPCFVYRNNLDTAVNRSLRIELKGAGKNTRAIGARVTIKNKEKYASMEYFPSKGFQSCMEDMVHLGVGPYKQIDSLEIRWPNGRVSIHTNVKTNKTITFSQGEAQPATWWKPMVNKSDTCTSWIPFVHRDVDINFFMRERLLLRMNGFDGPAIAVGDINGDGYEDIFCGGGRNQASVLYLCNKGAVRKEVFLQNPDANRSEVTDAHFFDSDKDGDLDLYVAHGGKSFSIYATELHDQLYVNDGMGNFTVSPGALSFPYPLWTSDVATGDVNQDGWPDIVVAEKMKTDLYGIPGSIFILLNRKNNTYELIQPSSMKDIGMVSSVELANLNGDAFPDIVFCGEWMPIGYCINDQNLFTQSRIQSIPDSKGMWNEVKTADVNGDGALDLVAGNTGCNGIYSAGMKMYIHDFDSNGSMEQIVCQEVDGKGYPVHDIDEMFSQLPVLRKKYIHYRQFAKADMTELFGKEVLSQARVAELEETASCIFLQKGDGWRKVVMPSELQYSSVHTVYVTKNGRQAQLLAGGNDFRVKPQFGRQDASQGWRVLVSSKGDSLLFSKPETLRVKGELRSISPFQSEYIVFGINHSNLTMCKTE